MVALRRAAARARASTTRLVLTIHDELLFEGPEEEVERATAIVKEEMEGAYDLDPPLEVDVGVGHELAGGEVSSTVSTCRGSDRRRRVA